MDISIYIRPLLKWWWLIVLSTLIAGISSFIAVSLQPDIYQSRTTLMVGRFIFDPNPESGQIWTAQQLAGIYADFASREPIQAATMDALGITWMPSYSARVLPNTQIIEISVNDTVPERAQLIAAELANQIVSFTPTDSSNNEANRQEFIKGQLDRLQNQILRTQSDIETLQQDLGELNSAREISDANSKIQLFESKLYSLQSAYADLLSNTSEGASNTIQLLEPATLPRVPVGPNAVVVVMPALLIGATLAVGAAYVLEFLNKSIENIEDINIILPQPLLGEIPRLPTEESSWTFVDKDPLSTYAEAFRKLRTNIEISTRKSPIQTLLVSSATAGDGKSSIATNLAIAYSYLGKKVVLVDADFRRHRINQVLNLEKEPGLSELLTDGDSLSEVIQHWKGNIFVISSGKFLNNSTELLSSSKFLDLIRNLRNEADLIIFDGPPFFLSETSSLSSVVDGILIVVPIGAAKSDLHFMKSQIDMIETNVLGIVANRVVDKNYYGYYYSTYTDSQDQVKPKSDQVMVFKEKLNDFAQKSLQRLKSISSKREKRPVVKTFPKENIREVEKRSGERTIQAAKPTTVNEKTVPRIKTPRSMLEDVLLRNSMKSVDEGKEHLQDLAKKKRGQDT